jgi:hypothetical protein
VPKSLSDSALHSLQKDTFSYFLHETNPDNGLVPDNTRPDSPASIAAVGLALATYGVGVERRYVSRSKAIERVLTTLRFFWNSPHGPQPGSIGNKGFYYHFLDRQTGQRVWKSELSTIDTTLLLAGALAAAAYFDRKTKDEGEIRSLADALYRRADWQWALNGGQTVAHAWTPEHGFQPYRWEGYCEALLLYVLGLGSPTHPLPAECYAAWTKTYRWKKLYGRQFLYGGPLFMHQLSHIWIDFRGIQDDYMREKDLDYFENSRRATYIQQQYAIRNPKGFRGYGANTWGITAGFGPGPATRRINGSQVRFFDYRARSIPNGPDDGTLAPWAAVACLPFAPEIVLPALQNLKEAYPEITSKYGFKCSFNPTFASSKNKQGWISKGYYGLDQGPIVLMIENYRSGQLWRLMRQCDYIVMGLRRAGFSGGWLGSSQTK